MSRRKLLAITVGVALIGAIGAVSIAAAVSAPASLPAPASVPAPASLPVVGAPGVSQNAASIERIPAELNIEATLTSVPAKVGQADALSRVEADYPSIATQATSVSAFHVILTAPGIPGTLPGSNIAPRNLSAWMVTFHGVVHLNHGVDRSMPATTAGYSRTIFMDADSGQQLMGMEYFPGD